MPPKTRRASRATTYFLAVYVVLLVLRDFGELLFSTLFYTYAWCRGTRYKRLKESACVCESCDLRERGGVVT